MPPMRRFFFRPSGNVVTPASSVCFTLRVSLAAQNDAAHEAFFLDTPRVAD
jgi:hypothetical protein